MRVKSSFRLYIFQMYSYQEKYSLLGCNAVYLGERAHRFGEHITSIYRVQE
jgi:hypothetical protein